MEFRFKGLRQFWGVQSFMEEINHPQLKEFQEAIEKAQGFRIQGSEELIETIKDIIQAEHIADRLFEEDL